MSSRRKFLQQSFAAGALLSHTGFVEQISTDKVSPQGELFPMIVSTWDNRKANDAAWKKLQSGGSALDAVEAGIHIPEADPKDMSVGYGGLPDREGRVTLDACIMNEKGMAGSVSFLENILHPISVARRVMEKTPHVMLTGEGALQFALEEGFPREKNMLTEEAKKAFEDWKIKSQYKPVINSERHDTIGMLVMDARGVLCGGCSTSGLAYKMRGRVGDSPIIGAGLYIDNEAGGATCTGLGELVLRSLSSFLAVEEMRRGTHPQKAAEIAVKRIMHKYPEECKLNQVGLIAVDKKGRVGAFSIHEGFNVAIYQGGQNRVFEAPFVYKKVEEGK